MMRFGLEQLLLVLTSTATFATLSSLLLSSSSGEHTTETQTRKETIYNELQVSISMSLVSNHQAMS